MPFTLTILGSSSALPTSRRFPTAQVLNVHERFFLIDCGEGTQMQLRKYRFRLGRLNHILISHLHGDHVFGLFGLLSSLGLMGRDQDLHLFGPEELENVFLKHLEMFDIHLPYTVRFHPLSCRKSEKIYENRHVEITAFPLKHRIPTCGFFFREKERLRKFRKDIFDKYDIPLKVRKEIQRGADLEYSDGSNVPNDLLTEDPPPPRTYAYCSDTAYDRSIVTRIRHADLLYHEATFAVKDADLAAETGHSTAREAAMLAAEAEVKQLVIGHFSARYKDPGILLEEARSIFKNTYLAEDGTVFSVPLLAPGKD